MNEAFVERFVELHGMSILAVARRYASCSTDADDVYQQTLEVVCTKAPTRDPEELAAWAKVVARNFAIDQLRRVEREVPATAAAEEDFASDVADPLVAIENSERDSHLRQAVRRLRPDHARCLLLRADGLGYPAIADATGFSYAKVNRCLSEGRKDLQARFTRIESGADCARLSGALSMYADGELSVGRDDDLLLHLNDCLACRQALIEFRAAPKRVAAALPLPAVDLVDPALIDRLLAPFRRLGETAQSAVASAQSMLSTKFVAVQTAAEVATVKNAAIAVGLTTSIVAGGVGVGEVVNRSTDNSGGTTYVPTLPVEARPENSNAPEPVATTAPAAASTANEEPREATTADAEAPRTGTSEVDELPAYTPPSGLSAPADDSFGAPSTPDDASSQDGAGSLPGLAP